MSRLKRLIREAHQRSLWQALVIYLGASYAVLEAVALFRDEFGLPDWLLPVALSLLVIGLPVVIVTSLAKEEVYGDEVPAEHAEAAAEEAPPAPKAKPKKKKAAGGKKKETD